MNTLIIQNNNIEINSQLITKLQTLNSEVTVISLIAKTPKNLEKAIQDLTKQKVTYNGLLFLQQDKYIIFGLCPDTQPNTIICFQLLYYLSAYLYFIPDNDEYEKLFKSFEIPQNIHQKLLNLAPKVPERYCRQQLYKPSKKQNPKLAGKPKLLECLRMRGVTILDMILNYCEFYNSNKSCFDPNFYDITFKTEYKRRIDDVKQIYQDQIVQLQQYSRSDKIILDQQDLDVKQRQILNLILQQLDLLNPKLKELKTELINKINEDYEQLIEQNSQESMQFCSLLMAKYKEIFSDESKNLDDMIQQRDIFIKSKSSQFEEILSSYIQEAIGPYKYKTIADVVPSFLFELFDQWFEGLNAHYMSEFNLNKATLLQTQDNLNDLQARFSDIESKKFELENQTQSLYFDLESNKREVEKLSKLKEVQEEISERQIKELKLKYQKCKDKKKEYKEKCDTLIQDQKKQQQELQERKKELAIQLMKNQKLEQALEQLKSKDRNGRSGPLQEELYALLKQFQDNISVAEEQLQRLSINSNQNQRTSNVEFNQFMKQIEKWQTKYDEKKKSKQALQDKFEDLQSKFEIMKIQFLELEEKHNQTTRQLEEQKQSSNQEEYQKLMAVVNKQNEDFMSVLASHKDYIEKLNQENSQLQGQYYELTMKYSELNYQKQNLLTVLREAIKLAQKKSNTLNAILRSMPVDIQQEIKDIIIGTGLKL
ncbi:hypothetical protein pb186bvf_005958 [Paramecium bursaria]